MKYMNIGILIIALAFSVLAWTSKDDYVKFGTTGGLVVLALGLLRQEYLRKHSEAKSK